MFGNINESDIISGDDSTYPNKLLIRGIPLNCTEVQIAKFMLEKTGYSMVQGSMTFHKCDPSVAMATFEENIGIPVLHMLLVALLYTNIKALKALKMFANA
ncbi:hypothetical protein DPMN_119680 [Dreissena polymorpha]|uniref:Uncharacterized protein n=1 Tax=Dreissena polymorpha TaxID=45954 RepID=A0A9D4GMC0_DREPO|nr:hypothetical protein DPMN_119680 [Dreissena polymorpha]